MKLNMLNILEKAVHALKKAVKELEPAVDMQDKTKIKDITRELKEPISKVDRVVMRINDRTSMSLGEIPKHIDELAEGGKFEELRKFLHDLARKE